MEENRDKSNRILTADIGGSHITVGVCNVDTLEIEPETITRVEVQSKGTATEILTSWANAFAEVLRRVAGMRVLGLSVAMPGPFDYQNGISYIRGLSKYEAIYGMNIKRYFAELLNLDENRVRFRNDAEAAIAGEVLMGAGKGFERVMGITLGTGFGSAFSDHKSTFDINLGSQPFKESIADDYLSTRWFLRRYTQLAGVSLTAGVKELAQLAETGAIAHKVFKEFAAHLFDFLSEPIARYSPDVLIVCGNIAKASRLFLPELQELLSSLPIEPGTLNEDASLIGAASLFQASNSDL